MNAEIEESLELQLDFDKLADVAATGQRVIPAVLQNAESGRVLFVGYANEQALQATLDEQIAVLWSTSRNELWRKGATSGDVLHVVEVRVNCEQNSVLYRVVPQTGGVCHTSKADGTARDGCYYRVVNGDHSLQFAHD